MAKIEDGLLTDESITYHTRLHWIVLLFPGIWTGLIFLGILGSALSKNKDEALGDMIFFFLLAGFWLLVRFLKRRNSEFALTTKRVIIHVGVLASKSFEINLPKIEGIGVEQTILGKILGYGSLVINGTGGSKEVFKQIEHPFEFRKRVQGQIGK